MKNVFLFLALALALNCSAQVHTFTVFFEQNSTEANGRQIFNVMDSVLALVPTSDVIAIQVDGYSWEWTSVGGILLPLCHQRNASVIHAIEKWRQSKGLPPQGFFQTSCFTSIRGCDPNFQKVTIQLDRVL